MNVAFDPVVSHSPALDVASVVERLAELRSAAQRRRYTGPTPQLPSRQSILSMIDDLFGAVYPRHFGGRDLPNSGLDLYVAQALERAVPVLEREIALELSLSDPGAHVAQDAAEIAAAIVDALPQIRESVDLDVRASLAADPAQGTFDELVFCSAGVAAILSHRVAHELYRHGVPLMAKIIAGEYRSRTGIEIHPGAEIGEGFSIAGAAGLTIGETAIIGRNVRIHAPATLGESFAIEGGATDAKPAEKGGRRHPKLEDDVVIQTGAALYGPIVVGRGSVIGRNVWLLRDTPPHAHVESTSL